MLYCDQCSSVTALNWHHETSCYCGKCYGKYVGDIKIGRAIFTELYTKKPKYLWVIGITNDFLTEKKPTYREWDRKDLGLLFKKHKSNIIRLQPYPSKTLSFRKFDSLWVKPKTFFRI